LPKRIDGLCEVFKCIVLKLHLKLYIKFMQKIGILKGMLICVALFSCKSLSQSCENLATGKSCCDDLETYSSCIDKKGCCWLALSNLGFISESCSMPNKYTGESPTNFCTKINTNVAGKMGTKVIKCGCQG